MDSPEAAPDPAAIDRALRRWRETRDPADFAALFDSAAPRLFRAAVRLTRDGAAAEDVLQETFLAVLETADGWDAGRPAWPWLTGILQRKAADAWRRRERAARPIPVPEAREADPADAAVLDEDLSRVRAALEDLPEPYRRAAVLRWRYGLEPGEIADALGEPPGTVRSWLSRARERLETRLRTAPLLAILAGPAPRGLEGVRASVLGAARLVAPPAVAAAGFGAAALTGGVLMTKNAVAASAAVLLLFGASGWWALRAGPDTPSPEKPPGRSPSRVAAAVEPAPPPEAEAPPAPRPRAEDECALEVRVVDGTGRPVAGATLESYRRALDDPDGEDVFDRMEARESPPTSRGGPTDASGAAAWALPEGSWTVTARAPGHASAGGDVVLSRERAVAPLKLVLWPAISLDGTVLAAPGRPRPGGEIRAVAFGGGPLPASRGAVDSAGRFRLEGLRPGRHVLTYCPRPGIVLAAGAVEVPGAGPLELLLPGGVTVRGCVLDADSGAPVPGAGVAVLLADVYASRHHEARAVAGPEGEFRFDDLPPGRVSGFHVRAAGFLDWPDGGGDSAFDYQWRFVHALPGGIVEEVIRIRRGAAVRGRVTLPDGTPVPGASIRLFGSVPEGGMLRPRSSPEARSGPDGSYRAAPVLPGRNVIVARAPGLCAPGQPWSVFNALSEPALAPQWIVDVPGTGEVERDVVLARGVTVEGTVVDEGGAPVAGCLVGRSPPWGTLGPKDGWERWTGRGTAAPSDGSGAYSVTGLEEGDFVLEARGPAGLWGRSKRLSAKAGDSLRGVRVELQAGAVVAGTVLGEDGAPAPGARVAVTAGGGDRDPARLDWLRSAGELHPVGADGRFRIEGLAAGDWLFHAMAPGRAPASRILHAVRAGSVKEDLALVLPAGRSLEGRVVDEAGNPVPGAAVSILPAEGRERLPGIPIGATAASDAEGRFRQGALGEGDHLVRVSRPGLTETSIVAPAGGPPIEVVLPAPRRIAGRAVVDPDGSPASGALVTCFPAERPPGMPRGVETRAREDGAFLIEGLAPGAHILYVGGPTDDFVRAKVEGVEAGTEDLEVRVRRGLAIAGRLLDSAGRPVSGSQVFARAEGEGATGERGRSGQGMTGSDGSFVVRGLAAGTFTVSASVIRGGGHHQPEAKGVTAGTTDLRLVLPASSDERLPPTEVPLGDLRIEGRLVLRGGGVPASGISVFARPVEPDAASKSRTQAPAARADEDGRFVIEGLDPGRCLLHAALRHEKYAPAASTEPVEAGATGVVIELVESVAVAGRLRGDGAAGIRFIRGVPEGPAGAFHSWTAVKDDGTFEIRGVPPGLLTLSGWTEGGKEVLLQTATAPVAGLEVRVDR